MNKKILLLLIVASFIALFCILSPILIYLFISQPHKIVGISMEPTFHEGDFVLSNKMKRPKRGNVVIYRSDGIDKIGRVVAVEHEQVEIKYGKVYINHEEEDVYPDGYRPQETFGANNINENQVYSVPELEYFILGDNRDNSKDSRFIGFIKIEDIKGVYMLTYKKAN